MSAIRTHFLTHFNYNSSLAVQSPGRINLIGEHTDYNNGFVLPAAIDKYVEVAIGKRTDGNIHMLAIDLNKKAELSIKNLKPHSSQWVNYIIGVVYQAIHKLDTHNSSSQLEALNKGFDICIKGNIPSGAGLSSSAAVECAVLFAINELYDLQFNKMEMALMAQKAENDFAGVKCGLMDMFASIHGQKNKVILLDCARLDFEQGVHLIQQYHPHVKTLRDVTIEQVEKYLGPSTDTPANIYKRCKYIVAEIHRVQAAVLDLEVGAMQAFGKKMFETHEGLSKLYEVSCPELDFLVEAVKDNENVIGARMMGAGFGGCTINIIKKSALEMVTQQVAASYAQQTNKELAVYVTSIEEGTHLIK